MIKLSSSELFAKASLSENALSIITNPPAKYVVTREMILSMLGGHMTPGMRQVIERDQVKLLNIPAAEMVEFKIDIPVFMPVWVYPANGVLTGVADISKLNPSASGGDSVLQNPHISSKIIGLIHMANTMRRVVAGEAMESNFAIVRAIATTYGVLMQQSVLRSYHAVRENPATLATSMFAHILRCVYLIRGVVDNTTKAWSVKMAETPEFAASFFERICNEMAFSVEAPFSKYYGWVGEYLGVSTLTLNAAISSFPNQITWDWLKLYGEPSFFAIDNIPYLIAMLVSADNGMFFYSDKAIKNSAIAKTFIPEIGRRYAI